MAFLIYFGTFCAISFILFLIKALSINRHWEKRGIPGPKPVPFFGNFFSVVTYQKSMGEIYKNMYDAFPNEPVVGYYHFMQPGLMIRDKNLVDKILIKDFPHFHSRFGTPAVRVVNDPLNANLFLLNGFAWKAVRSKFAPIFATGKLRSMFPHLSSIGDRFIDLLGKTSVYPDFLKEVSTYTIDVIASTAFGMDTGPMEDKDNEFRAKCRAIMPANLMSFIRFQTVIMYPALAAKLTVNAAAQKSVHYFTDIIKDVMTHRKTSGVSKHDFIQSLLAIQEKGSIDVRSYNSEEMGAGSENTEFTGSGIPTSDDMLAGQAFAFMIAGIEATTTSLFFIVYDFAKHSNIQEKTRAEVREIMKKFGGEITYDSMKEMEFLDSCIKETLRVHSPVTVLTRICTKDYKLPNVPHTTAAGDLIVIPSQAIQLDPNNYDEPTRYLPERWAGNAKVDKSIYLSWGAGPRLCTGMRFAQEEIKSVVIKMLLNYRIKLHPSARDTYSPNPMGFFNVPKEKIPIILEKL